MMWIMSGWTQVAESGWLEHREPVRTYIEADSMDEAFEKARAVYGDGIDTAQPMDGRAVGWLKQEYRRVQGIQRIP